MKKRLLYVGALLAYGLVSAQQQQDSTKVEQLDEVVITDSRFKLKREHSGKTVIKIDAIELAKNQGKTLAEVINTKSGIEVNGSRSNGGQNISTFVRGGNNRQVLVLIDGIQVSDASSVANDFDLRLLDLSQVENIEIIKGAASTLYGSNAATAVINITTKKASDKKISAVFSSSLGTNQSAKKTNYDINNFSNAVSVNGTLKKFYYIASLGHQHVDGLSAVQAGTEKDEFSRTNVGLNVEYNFTDNLSLKAFITQERFTTDFDNTYPALADALFSSTSDQYRLGVSPKYKYKNGSITVNTSLNRINRAIKSSYPNDFNAKSLVIDAFNKYNFNNQFYTIVGVNHIKNEVAFTEDKSMSNFDPYANVVWVSDFGLNFNAGARFNNHSEYGNHFTYNINPSYTYKLTDGYVKFLGSYSTSFIAPNLSQLFGPFGANPNLKPETNVTLEAGSEFKLGKKLLLSAVYFNRDEKDFIGYGQDGYYNVEEEFTVNGVEVELTSTIVENLQFSANYTFTELKEKVALRIPKHKINANVSYNFTPKNYVGLSYQYLSDRLDKDFTAFPALDVDLKSFSLVNFNFGREIMKDRLAISGGISNILNEDYEEVLGYTTKGRNFRLGFRLNF